MFNRNASVTINNLNDYTQQLNLNFEISRQTDDTGKEFIRVSDSDFPFKSAPNSKDFYSRCDDGKFDVAELMRVEAHIMAFLGGMKYALDYYGFTKNNSFDKT